MGVRVNQAPLRPGHGAQKGGRYISETRKKVGEEAPGAGLISMLFRLYVSNQYTYPSVQLTSLSVISELCIPMSLSFLELILLSYRTPALLLPAGS